LSTAKGGKREKRKGERVSGEDPTSRKKGGRKISAREGMRIELGGGEDIQEGRKKKITLPSGGSPFEKALEEKLLWSPPKGKGKKTSGGGRLERSKK